MSRSAQSLQRTAYLILAFVFVFGGLGFGLYLWNDTKIVDARAQESSPGPSPVQGTMQRIAPALALKVEERGPTGLYAVVTLTNTSGARMVIPDLLGIEPLYSVTLRYAPTKSDELHDLPRAAALQAGRTTIADMSAAVPFDSERDVAVELLPGRSHEFAVPLSQWYVPKPGHFELRVQFRPTNMVAAGDTLRVPAFNSTMANAQLVFDYPLVKPGAAPAKPDAPAQNVDAEAKPK